MSGGSREITCPNCEKDAIAYEDYKPVEYIMIQCFNCGLEIYPKITWLTFEALNEQRKELSLKELTIDEWLDIPRIFTYF